MKEYTVVSANVVAVVRPKRPTSFPDLVRHCGRLYDVVDARVVWGQLWLMAEPIEARPGCAHRILAAADCEVVK